MSGQNWDDEDFEAPTVDDRWDGEDEDKVKDNWDDDDDEDSKPAPQTSSEPAVKKKSKRQIILEKQKAKEEALKAKREEIRRMNAEMTPEEKLAEKLRLQKMQEDSDLQFAVDMMGMKDVPSNQVDCLSEIDISTQAGIESLGDAIIKKIRGTERLEKRSFYPLFLENFCKDLCLNLDVDEVKKVTSSLNALCNDKVKSNKKGGKKKGAGKAKIQQTGKGKQDLLDDDRYLEDFDDFI